MRRLGTLAASIALLAAAPASADTFTVNTNADAGGTCAATCSIRGALASAAQNGTDTEDLIVVPANTYQLAQALTVDSRVIVRGAGARLTAVRGSKVGQALWRVFDVVGVVATIQNLTMENGGAGSDVGGNLRNTGGIVVLDHVRVTGGLASDGGGIANESGSMTIRSSLIDANEGGGVLSRAIAAPPSSLSVNDSTIALNTLGVGVQLRADGQSNTARLERVTVANNDDNADPGGIDVGSGSTLQLIDSIVAGNTGDNLSPPANCGGVTPTSGGGNIEDDVDCGLAAATGDLPGTDPALSPA